jgi:hypothetical protein
MDEKEEETLVKILNLCDSDPDAGLEIIENILRKTTEDVSAPFWKFAKAIAYGGKGLFQLTRSISDINFTVLDGEEMRDVGISDTHLDYLEKGLQEIKEMEEIYPGALKMFGTEEDRMGELKVDAMAMVLERCKPGRVQQILGETKLKYFGSQSVKYLEEKLSQEDFKVFSDVFFSFHFIVRTAIIIEQGRDNKGRKYILCALSKRTVDNLAPSETIGDVLELEDKDIIFIFDDGTFENILKE